MKTNFEATNRIRERTLAEGFDIVGFADADIGTENGEHLSSFVENEFHGEMGWLADSLHRRKSPRDLWPQVSSIIVIGANYASDHSPHERLQELLRNSRGNISVYARNRDYHDVLKKRLKRVARWMCKEFGCDVKVFVDTAPVLEKPLASRAGLGWQGKHTNLVSRQFGSWLFLGEIYTTLSLAPNVEENDRCGTCQRCLKICPTDAFPAPYQLDARKCISYLTIEHKGHIATKYRRAMGTRIYGCDDCLSVCPWNKFAQTSQEAAFIARNDLTEPKLSDLLTLDDIAFRRCFRKSPIKRIGRDRFIRNVLIAAGNSGNNSLEASVVQLLKDPSAIVRAMAVWALGEIVEKEKFKNYRDYYERYEQDDQVCTEWRCTILPTQTTKKSV